MSFSFFLFIKLISFQFFVQAKIFFSYHILMNILIYKLFCDKKAS